MPKFSNNMEGYRNKDKYIKDLKRCIHGIAASEGNKEHNREKKLGPRGIFLNEIEKDDVTVEQVIKYTLKQINGLSEEYMKNIIKNLTQKEKDNLSPKVLKKIQEYLEELGQGSPRESDDDAR